MNRKIAHYRGYKIEGENDERSWLVRVRPVRVGLPILWFSTFRVTERTWNDALSEAHMHIDAVISQQLTGQRGRSLSAALSPVTGERPYILPELELIFDSVWEVIRPHGILSSEAERQLRLALARRLVILATSGITEARELRRQAIEHFLLSQ